MPEAGRGANEEKVADLGAFVLVFRHVTVGSALVSWRSRL